MLSPRFPIRPATTKAYDTLPARTRELLLLQNQMAKSTGQESVALHREARQEPPRLPWRGKHRIDFDAGKAGVVKQERHEHGAV
jgi:hypothetical protein